MQEMCERLALTALLMALLIVLVWIGILTTARRQSRHPAQFSDALWTMTHIAREDDR